MNYSLYLCKDFNNVSDDKINQLSEILEIAQDGWIIFKDDDVNMQIIIDSIDKLTQHFIWLVFTPDYPLFTAQELQTKNIGWICPIKFIREKFSYQLELLFFPFQLLQTLIKINIIPEIKIIKPHLRAKLIKNKNLSFSQPKILAIVPHLNCNQWLDYCLLSLVNQTVPVSQIVVIDDNSLEIPKAICHRYPQVTLLKTSKSVGPYQIIQSIIEQTNYDAYLFQDADDWSMPRRLEILLELMMSNNADLVGTQEYRVDEINQQVIPVTYPLDVNLALKDKPGHALLHPTSLIKRSAVLRLNGFANGLLFGGDTEFLLRAHWELKICNSPEFGYFRRKRVNSLTTSLDTGLDSSIRQDLLQKVKAIAYDNYQRINQGQKPLTQPLATQKMLNFTHVCGSPIINDCKTTND
jgi:hypothetical protein